MNKSRKGVALIMALVVVVVGGALVAVTFDVIMRYAWFSPQEAVAFVDHTVMIDAIQAAKAHIVHTNNTSGAVMHAQGLRNLHDGWITPNPLLWLDGLFIYSADIPLGGGIGGGGRQRVTLAVYDMLFDPGWISPDALRTQDIPPIFNMVGETMGGGMTPEGDPTDQSIYYDDRGMGGEYLDPELYGAYLIRAQLYDHRNVLIRTAEEAFVQILEP